MEQSRISKNNFDIIRLFAAIQVVIRHLFYGVQSDNIFINYILKAVMLFPGVPIFFTISGFLIFWSFDRNNNIKNFFLNRFLRIYPGLWVCLFVTILLLIIADNQSRFSNNLEVFLLWIFGQITFVQFWTPDFLKFWGEGTPNGSLWTIFVELQFYFFVPFFYFLLKKSNKYKIYVVVILSIFSILFNNYIGNLERENIIHKLGFVSLFTYLFYFLNGVIIYFYWDKIKHILIGKSLLWLLLYVMLCVFFGSKDTDLNNYYINHPVKIIFSIVLSLLVISKAFSFSGIGSLIIGKTDISYGIYIYHMVIINFFHHNGFLKQNVQSYTFLFLTIILISSLSWFLVERPCLKYKLR